MSTSVNSLVDANSSMSDIYSPLAEGEIRLVKLIAGSGRPIRCSPIQTPSAEAPPYEPLSYVWGSEKPSRETIWPLYALRWPARDRLLWIDALAINQLDLDERNSQVAIMPSIYSGSVRTIAWLGGWDAGPLEPGLWEDTMDKLFARISAPNFVNSFDSSSIAPLEELQTEVRTVYQLVGIEYWTRVWVMQELASSHSVVFQYGRYLVEFEVLRSWLKWLDHCWEAGGGYWPVNGTLDTSTFLQGIEVFRTVQLDDFVPGSVGPDGGLLDMNSWLGRCCQLCHCSDPRDKIFGFNNCMTPGLKKCFAVDYTKTVPEVFAYSTRAIFDIMGNLEFMNKVDKWARPDADSSYMLPSWVPNFGGRFFEAADFTQNDTPSSSQSFYEVTDSGMTLRVRGQCLGICERVSDAFVSSINTGVHGSVADSGKFATVFGHLKQAKASLGVQADSAELQSFVRTAIWPAKTPIELEKMQNLIARDDGEASELEDHGRVVAYWLNHHGQPMFSFHLSAGLVDDGDSTREFGIGVVGMRPGDQIWSVLGLAALVIVRPLEGEGHFTLVGTAYSGIAGDKFEEIFRRGVDEDISLR
ncbi:heterokaryon incompatibility protein-domain-containing protein [Echria macrotheca]|uniref:Heterokaryon incompatibility protein-domain-containing protein n=1 Tax=Echria macrotheca TaxID=438768 RepID=A0AAJ0B0C2_9PEZI|nr:heterokaryon incompatibility protein-domain-containing protein [Echria macrotheca]